MRAATESDISGTLARGADEHQLTVETPPFTQEKKRKKYKKKLRIHGRRRWTRSIQKWSDNPNATEASDEMQVLSTFRSQDWCGKGGDVFHTWFAHSTETGTSHHG